MQKLNFRVYVVIGLALFFSSCHHKVDIEKEKEAIKAVIEAEKQGYFDKNLEKMAATWVQKSSSVKMFMSQVGEVDLFGWAKISERSKEEIAAIDSSYRNIHLEFSDFQFNIYESSAWAIFKARWNWFYKEEQKKLEQTRIMAFEKVEGKWKITLMAIYAVPIEKEEAQK
jgi:hypothetical protein